MTKALIYVIMGISLILVAPYTTQVAAIFGGVMVGYNIPEFLYQLLKRIRT